MLAKKLIKIIQNDSNIAINDKNTYWSIYVGNPCGEDFTFEIEKTTNKDDVNEIIDFCEYFDPEEHAKNWFGANNGEPNSLRQLLENSDNIKDSLLIMRRKILNWFNK